MNHEIGYSAEEKISPYVSFSDCAQHPDCMFSPYIQSRYIIYFIFIRQGDKHQTLGEYAGGEKTTTPSPS